MSGASVTMAADSTIGEINEDAKKRKKNKTHKKNKKLKKRGSGDEGSSDSDLDLDKEMHPISHYVKDRDVLVQQLFRSITAAKLRAMLPELLKPYSIEELKSLCLEQLEVMSRKRILRILQGEDADNISSSSTEDDTDEEKAKNNDAGVQEEDAKVEEEDGEKMETRQAADEETTPVSEIASLSEEESNEVHSTVASLEDDEAENDVIDTDTDEEVEDEESEEGEESDGSKEEAVEEEKTPEGDTAGEMEEGEMEEGEVEEDDDEAVVEDGSDEVNKMKMTDTRRVELKTKHDLKSSVKDKMKSSKLKETTRSSTPDILLLPEQEDVDDLCKVASSVGNTKSTTSKTKVQASTSGGKPAIVHKSEERSPEKHRQKRDLVQTTKSTIKKNVAKTITQDNRSDAVSQAKQVKPAASSIKGASQKGVKRSSSSKDKAKRNTDNVDDDVKNIIGASSTSAAAADGVFLSKNQMEILELEMRARAIKAMLKMHSKEEKDPK